MYDLIIRNGLIFDGTGRDAYPADIGVIGDRIAYIGDLSSENARRIIDATGKSVTPGFIEPHSHADLGVILSPSMEAYLMQGVTTVVGGNCGHGMAPIGNEVYRSAIVDFPVVFEAQPRYFELFSPLLPKREAAAALKRTYGVDLDWRSFREYIDKCNSLPMDCNIAPLAGYSAIRGAAMGFDSLRPATPDELDRLAALVEECMEAGAFGISTGRDPIYVPGPYATDEETIRMLKLVKEYGGVFSSHTYNAPLNSAKLDRMGGYREMLEQARAARIRANVSHVHVLGMGTTPEEGIKAALDTIAYFEQMEGEGLDISYDVIPSPNSADFTIPYFAFLLRPFVLISGTRAQLAKHFRVPDFRQMVHTVVKAGMYPSLDPSQPTNFYRLVTVLKHRNPSHVGKNLMAYATEQRMDPLDLTMDLFAEDPDMAANTSLAAFEEANAILCRHRMAMPCADGMACTKDSNFTTSDEMPLYPNPMTFSFIPRYILLHGKPRFEDTIHQISAFVAERFNIAGRGVLTEGNYADIVVLDRARLRSYDTDENPLQYPDGFDHVIVNGVPTIENKRHLGAAAGRMLTKVS